MASDDPVRNDETVQAAARNLFYGVAPERRHELETFWATYQPHFNLLLDSGPDGLFVMDAGAYKDVRFNHRAMRAFWLAAFIAWEGYRAFAESTGPVENVDLSRFRAMVGVFEKMLAADNAEDVPLPPGVPEPGIYPDAQLDPTANAPAQLATIATGWALLHEVWHLQHQQAGTSAPRGAPPEERHAEELSCDAFATAFILEKVHDFAAKEDAQPAKVRFKRELGIYLALFAMTLIVRGAPEASDSHPAMQIRIDRAIQAMGTDGTRVSDAIAHVAFAALWSLYPGAPGPFKVQPS